MAKTRKPKGSGVSIDAIEQIPTTDLIPYARNARTHSDEQVAQIAASIREFGFCNPVLIDGQNTIIAGPGHRPENKDWARVMHAKCSEQGTAFFHKQSAGWRTELGIELDGRIVREYPTPRTVTHVGTSH